MAATMIVGAFTFGVSAADAVVGTNQIVGTRGTNNTYEDGVANFKDNTMKATVVLNISDQQDRYAVDIEFGNLTFNMIGGLVWDVNQHDFVQHEDAALPTISTRVTLTNHSSKPVYWLVNPIESTDLDDYIMFHCAPVDGLSISSPNLTTHSYSGEVGSALSGTAVKDGIDIKLEKLDNVTDDALLSAIAKLDTTTVTLGTIEVTVSMNTTPSVS